MFQRENLNTCITILVITYITLSPNKSVVIIYIRSFPRAFHVLPVFVHPGQPGRVEPEGVYGPTGSAAYVPVQRDELLLHPGDVRHRCVIHVTIRSYKHRGVTIQTQTGFPLGVDNTSYNFNF